MILVRASRMLTFLAGHVAAFTPLPLTFSHWGELNGRVMGVRLPHQAPRASGTLRPRTLDPSFG